MIGVPIHFLNTLTMAEVLCTSDKVLLRMKYDNFIYSLNCHLFQ